MAVDPFREAVLVRTLDKGAARVKNINETTRQGIAKLVADGVSQGLSPRELGDVIESWSGFDEYRAEMIARTETGTVLNETAIRSYSDYGVREVQVTDGDGDEICASVDGRTFAIDDAPPALGHPNCTRDFLPVMGLFPAQAAPSAPEAVAPAEPAPLAVPPPAPSAKDLISPVRNPVSRAFDDILGKVRGSRLAMMDPQYVKVVDKIERALGTIDRTFIDGNLPDMPSIGPIKGGQAGLQGRYAHQELGRRLPQSLEFRSNANMETVFHELSHFIDHHGLGTGEQFASRLGFAQANGRLNEVTDFYRQQMAIERSLGNVTAGSQRAQTIAEYEAKIVGTEARADLMEPVMRSIMDSDGYKALVEARKTGRFMSVVEEPGTMTATLQPATLSANTVKWVTYATRSEEAFARAMAQYLSKRAGREAMIEIEDRLFARSVSGVLLSDASGSKLVAPLADQWTWEDFAAIDDAISAMLRKIGWLLE